MMRYGKSLATAALLLFGAAACSDLQVDNTIAPDADRALSTPGDVESLIAGSWTTWWSMNSSYNGLAPALSTMSFQHSAYPANFGMVDYSVIPRRTIPNSPSWGYYTHFHNPYTWGYRAIAAVNDAFRAIDEEKVDLGSNEPRARAFGRFVQGIAYGYLAMLYDKGAVVDETADLLAPQEYKTSADLFAQSMDYLDEAIEIATDNDFTIPKAWMHTVDDVESDLLAKMAHSFKARIRANMPRTPAEAAEIDWQAVIDDIDNGVTEDVGHKMNYPTIWHSSLYYTLLDQWSQMNYMVAGMADQSNKYQKWMSLPIGQRTPEIDGEPFLIITPDLRFPQGATLQDQANNPGTRYEIPVVRDEKTDAPVVEDGNRKPNTGGQWQRDDRGTWRWSYYRDVRRAVVADVGVVYDLTVKEMDLLKAEAFYWLDRKQEAADIINVTRVAAGLSPADPSAPNDGNTSCVPKLPNGECGDLLEMLKWEKRMEAGHNAGNMMASWYFDSRRWGDLMEGTILQFPVPAQTAEIDAQPILEYGGSADWSAPVGTYGY